MFEGQETGVQNKEKFDRKKLREIMGYSSIAGILALGTMELFSSYRMERVSAFLDPWDAPRHTDEWLTEALITFGRSWFARFPCGSFAGNSSAL
ncbi:MAG: hypothetical protein AB2604_13245 [Candidatus Thiodiazotropha taylori]|nr:hypothetical protein [Candidatus Thiodiazotropha taylori]